METFLTKTELSEIIKVSEATIDRWRKEGMPYEKMGRGVRFNEKEVLDWIRQNKGQK